MSREMPLVSVASHPVAGASVRRAKSWGGLVAFALVLVVGLRNDADLTTAIARALAGGIAVYLVTWAAAVAAWRHLLRAQARAVAAQLVRDRAER